MTERFIQTDELSPEQVCARFAAARRNGFPAWIWPDIAVGEWRAALAEIANVTRKVLQGEYGITLLCNDARAMGVAGYTSGMGPLLGYWIENGTIRAPGAVEDIFRRHLSHNRQRMLRLSDVAREVSERLAGARIAPLILKGMHTAYCYFPEPGVRPLSDIDLYVPAKSMPAAEQVFSSLGYRRTPRTRSPYACDWTIPSLPREPRTLAYVHRDDPWSFDVLGMLDKRLATGARIRLDRLLSSGGRAAWPQNHLAGVMAQPLLALYLAIHISQILLNATLLRLTELILVVRRDSAAGLLDWQEFLNGAAAIGGARFVYPALVLCEQLAPQTIPVEVLDAAAADAPRNLRQVMVRLTVEAAQPLDRHSVSERFMWASNWSECLRQVAAELAFDGRGRPIRQTLYSTGTKLRALRRRRYSA
ncbi:MAG TPA: nucleotidyltransferase family protein [Rhizomicrobium sp.]